jgi:hypothetical protein
MADIPRYGVLAIVPPMNVSLALRRVMPFPQRGQGSEGPQAINNPLKALIKMGPPVRVPVAAPGGGRKFAYRVAEANGIEHN